VVRPRALGELSKVESSLRLPPGTAKVTLSVPAAAA